MTDPVEAARRSVLTAWQSDLPDALDAFEAAIRADVVPTGDAGLDHAPDCDVFRIAESWEPYGEPRHCGCGFALWDAKRRGVYNWTPPTGDAGLDVERARRVFHNEYAVTDHGCRHSAPSKRFWDCQTRADEFAAEYARLSSSDTGGRG